MSNQTHRTCVRMGADEYELLKKKGRAAGLSANAWLMTQMEANRPIHRQSQALHRYHGINPGTAAAVHPENRSA